VEAVKSNDAAAAISLLEKIIDPRETYRYNGTARLLLHDAFADWCAYTLGVDVPMNESPRWTELFEKWICGLEKSVEKLRESV
jgi:hypothetical protein